MRIFYFAWIRHWIGHGTEVWTPQTPPATVAALVAQLRARGGGHARAFADMRGIRVAVNHVCAGPDTPLDPADEVIFFPPVAGG